MVEIIFIQSVLQKSAAVGEIILLWLAINLSCWVTEAFPPSDISKVFAIWPFWKQMKFHAHLWISDLEGRCLGSPVMVALGHMISKEG